MVTVAVKTADRQQVFIFEQFGSGDKKNDIKIIRGEEIIIVDLKQIESLQSPKIIIHDNDIIYVEPYSPKAALEPISSLTIASTMVLMLTQFVLIGLQVKSAFKL